MPNGEEETLINHVGLDGIGQEVVHTKTLRYIAELDSYNKSTIELKKNGIIQIEGDIPPTFEIVHGAHLLIISKDQSYLTHGVHKFPAKFFPELPRFLIQKYSNIGNTVLDPMCGSGTVILESILQNRNAVGVDIDPIAKLITKVKTTPIDKNKLRRAKKWIEDYVVEPIKPPEIPEFHYRDSWFKPFILEELSILKAAIDNILTNPYFSDFSEEERKNIYDFCIVIFSSIIRDVSNADPHCTRTVIRKKLNKKLKAGDAYRAFNNSLSKQIDNIGAFTKIYKTLQHKNINIPSNGDARKTGLEDDSVDLAVTSPPYINAVDYPRTHQLELYWLKFAKGSLASMKRQYIGTETVYNKEYAELKQSGLKTLDPLLEEIYHIDPRRAYIIYKFFEDMKANLKEVRRVLRPGGRYCIAIGNNTIRGKNVPSHEILKEVAGLDDVGFEVENYFFSGVINHFIKIPRNERMAGEWVIILKKNS